MELRRKKIIAREFLILMGCIGIAALCYVGLLLWNWHYINRQTNIDKEIADKKSRVKELLGVFERKSANQHWFYDKLNERWDMGPANSESIQRRWARWEQRATMDSIPILYEKLWPKGRKRWYSKIGFSNATDLGQFIRDNSISKEDKQDTLEAGNISLEILELQNESNSLYRKTIYPENVLPFTLNAFIISLIVSFPFRFLVKAIRWSIRVVRQKD